MSLSVATHSGPFHADDVLAWAMVRCFVDESATLVRTREPELIERSDMVMDVGGIYDPSSLRFDHHQHSYQGPLSSAGMVLEWLRDTQRISHLLFAELRLQLVRYVDDVDNGRVAPIEGIPCFPSMVDRYNMGCVSLEDFDGAFQRVSDAALGLLQGIAAGVAQEKRNEEIVRAAMSDAVARRSNIMVLETYVSWKKPYFAHGGAEHGTEFVLHPGFDGSWRVVAIPPELGSFAQKCSLPESWAGLRDEELSTISGVDGAVFCHKNRFIAVWKTREQLEEALKRANLLG
jgi:uncharacterized UPF0160 family protein